MPSESFNNLSQASRRIINLGLSVLWVAAFVLSVRYLLHYEKTPGHLQSAPLHWPEKISHVGTPGLPILVVALHPRCSCSRASLIELEKAAEGVTTPFDTLLLIYQPKSGDSDWHNNALYSEAQKSLKAQVVRDEDGRLAAQFGAVTSGDTILYSAQDRFGERSLLYAGGVTGARGMNGPNAGAEALVQAFHNQRYTAAKPVYGCQLQTFQEAAPVSAAFTRIEIRKVKK